MIPVPPTPAPPERIVCVRCRYWSGFCLLGHAPVPAPVMAPCFIARKEGEQA